MSKPLLFLLLLSLPLAATAQSIYRTVDEHGNVVFTDTPPPGGTRSEQVDMQPVNTAAPPPAMPKPAVEEKSEEAAAVSVSITSPANEETIPMGPGNFSVTAATEPALAKGEKLRLLMDGEPQGDPQSGASWSLSNVFRGQHDLTVERLGAGGKVLATSEPVRVYVQRPSTLINPPANAQPTIAPQPQRGGGAR